MPTIGNPHLQLECSMLGTGAHQVGRCCRWQLQSEQDGEWIQGSHHQRLDWWQRYLVPLWKYKQAREEWQNHEMIIEKLQERIQPKGRNQRNRYKSGLDCFREMTGIISEFWTELKRMSELARNKSIRCNDHKPAMPAWMATWRGTYVLDLQQGQRPKNQGPQTYCQMLNTPWRSTTT